jgi:heme/copper-type cytochrome/quinol oxidase subunit 2
MNIERLKTPPMVIGLFLAGLLLFAVVGIARKATGATVATAMQSNVGAAVARPVMPQAQPVALPVVQVVVVVTATPTRPPHNWLDIAVDVTGAWWVWGDSAWIACGRIAADLTYGIDQSEPSYRNWYWLHTNQRLAVYNRCLEVTR